ncbi:helix-turn-helix domain-containing protein [Bradyrhizobium japonicum]|uniref:helix-turn-helix domain-containing protein n=1 Tax=Bradyrhizobium japonicum TaxID=375 RepID=UPI0005772C23|nr:helix-turn-helix domain-containing protein [Bradyrhizobium japonicum]
MSWQATAWAIKQITGSTRRKALLLALANYADANGVCWPSQERLAGDTEQSVDSIQRHSVSLERAKLIEREIMPKRRGNYAGYRYRLALPDLRSPGERETNKLRPGQAAKRRRTAPHDLRHKPSLEPSYENSDANARVEDRLRVFQAQVEPLEVVQNRIAQRIGYDGWLILGDMNDHQRFHLSKLERQGRLDDKTLGEAVLAARCAAGR